MLDKRNIQAVGWQDIVMNPDNTVNEHFRNSKDIKLLLESPIPEQGGDEVPYKLANAGYRLYSVMWVTSIWIWPIAIMWRNRDACWGWLCG